jgi:hypothetical protein
MWIARGGYLGCGAVKVPLQGRLKTREQQHDVVRIARRHKAIVQQEVIIMPLTCNLKTLVYSDIQACSRDSGTQLWHLQRHAQAVPNKAPPYGAQSKQQALQSWSWMKRRCTVAQQDLLALVDVAGGGEVHFPLCTGGAVRRHHVPSAKLHQQSACSPERMFPRAQI